VFLARQGGAGSLAGVAKLVVIKRILGHMRRDDKHRRMFLDEARLQALLNNPHVVQVYDMGEEDGHVYLAMEHVLGPSWRGIIDRMRRLRQFVPIAHVCAMVSQAARGLSYAHNLVDVSGAPLKIVHRDINPLNVLVTYDGEVKIIDFGIAKSELQEGNTETGTIKGKFNYMSPEQSAARKLDQRSDLFALGICLQELLTNDNPFRRANVVLSLEAIQKEPAVRLARRRPEAGLLQPIVDRCLAKDPEDRFADAIFLSDELDELLASGAVPAPPEPLSSWLRGLFSGEIAEHMHILEATGSSNAMVRRDDAGSQRIRSAPRTASPVRAQPDIANQATKVTDSPLLDEPSFEVDSVSGDHEEPSLSELPDDQEGTAATPAGMPLASLTSPPSTGFDPFSSAPAGVAAVPS
jgi:serine/threonine-protein kinase